MLVLGAIEVLWEVAWGRPSVGGRLMEAIRWKAPDGISPHFFLKELPPLLPAQVGLQADLRSYPRFWAISMLIINY